MFEHRCFSWRRLLGVSGLAAALATGCGKSNGEQAVDLVLSAQAARAEGNPRQAKELLDRAIAQYQAGFCYLERARALAELGDIDAAIDDCERGLEIDPRSTEIEELLAECRKPAEQRFRQGAGLIVRDEK